MAKTPKLAEPAPMEGHGRYNSNSRVQATGLLPALALLERAAREALLNPLPQAIVIADYGSSEGHNSLLPLSMAIDTLRKRLGPERAISIVHTDLPDNDFTALFRVLVDDPDSYLRRDLTIFASAIGRSFYGQILPANSVTLGWSSWAVQWLSRLPALIPDQVQVAYSRDKAARDAYTAQAAEDWRTFLTARGRELSPGGRLVVVTMALTDDGDFGYRPLVQGIYAILQEMAQEGSVRPEEVARMVIPTIGRTAADLAAPFAETGSFAGLSLDHLRVFHAEDQIWAEFREAGDAHAFGARWAAFSRASVFPTLATALDAGRDASRSAEFIARLEAGVAARLAAAPEQMMLPLAELLICKEVA